MLSFSDFQAKAREMFGKEEYRNAKLMHPISFLYSLEWDTPLDEAYSEEKVAKMNLDFDTRSCFGRALKAAVLVEKYFPEEIVYSAEICEDFFRQILLEEVTPMKWQDVTYVEEILQYENPHIILAWKGMQFDASFKMIIDTPGLCSHPKIKQHDLWKGLYVAYAISEASLAHKGSYDRFLRMLEDIEAFYPEMITLQENKFAALVGLDRDSEAIEIAKKIVENRKDAKVLFSLWLLTNDDVYKNQILREYSEEMFYFLTKKFFS